MLKPTLVRKVNNLKEGYVERQYVGGKKGRGREGKRVLNEQRRKRNEFCLISNLVFPITSRLTLSTYLPHHVLLK